MIRAPKNTEDLSINVTLKDGTTFHAMDIPAQLFGQHERMVSFWLGDVIRIYPLSEVAFMELVPGGACPTKEDC